LLDDVLHSLVQLVDALEFEQLVAVVLTDIVLHLQSIELLNHIVHSVIDADIEQVVADFDCAAHLSVLHEEEACGGKGEKGDERNPEYFFHILLTQLRLFCFGTDEIFLAFRVAALIPPRFQPAVSLAGRHHCAPAKTALPPYLILPDFLINSYQTLLMLTLVKL
jgi:hypothetical protein